MKYIILFTIFLLNTAYNQTQESIYERINLAESYVEAGFKEDEKKTTKNIVNSPQDKQQKSTLGDLDVLSDLKDELEEKKENE